MESKSYPIPTNMSDCFLVLDDIFKESNDYEWFKSSDENGVVSGLHHGLGGWIRNTWGLWSKKTELYFVMKNMGIWHADDMSNIILTSYHRKINGKELKIKEQVDYYIEYWKKYEKTNGPIEKK